MSLHPITVSPTKNANGSIEWTLTYGTRSGNKNGDYPAIDLKHGGTNERFKITLIDSSLGIKFSKDPLWIQAGSCPTSTGIDAAQIDKVETSDTVVSFRDLNQNAAVSLWYRLNFDVPGLNPGDPGTFLDPEIRNGGGGGAGMKWLTFAGVAAAAVAVGYVAYEAFFEKY